MPRIERNIKKIQKKRRSYRETPAKAKTRETIFQIIEKYDDLLSMHTNNPSAETEEAIQKYQLYLKNKNQLALYFRSYVKDNHIEGTLLSNGKIRELITVELAKESLVLIDGIIRKPRSISIENTCSTGNVLTVLTKQEHIVELSKKLSKVFFDEPVKIFSPCNNMIMIIELGDYSPTMNDRIRFLAKQVTFDFALKNGLDPKATSDTLKYVLL